MKNIGSNRRNFPSPFALLLLASAVAFPALALHAQNSDAQSTPATTSDQTIQQQPPTAPVTAPITPAKEGFWGHVNPFARKKWVKRQTDPINDRLSELDGVNAKNSSDIKDVDARSQAGIRRAQDAADQANQTATAAGAQAQMASNKAQGASGHVDQLNSTVNGLDQYHQISAVEVKFRAGSPTLTADAKKQLDDLAASLTGHAGYIIEMEAHTPAHGSVGIETSARLSEAVKRYLVTEHEIPVYRMHSVALGNAKDQKASDQDSKPVRISSVDIRLMENSLAAQEAAPPQGEASNRGAAQQ